MPFQSWLEHGILRVSFLGVVTNHDLGRLLDEITRLEATCRVMPDRLVDMRQIDRLEIDFTGVLSLAQARRQRTFPNSFKTAIIATETVHFGFARMFQTLNDHAQIAVSIFDDDADALAWLEDG